MTLAAGAAFSLTLTLWAVFQFSVVKVSVEGVNSTLSWAKAIFTSAAGAAGSFTVAVWAVLQFSVVKVSDDGVEVSAAVISVHPPVVEGVAVASSRCAYRYTTLPSLLSLITACTWKVWRLLLDRLPTVTDVVFAPLPGTLVHAP